MVNHIDKTGPISSYIPWFVKATWILARVSFNQSFWLTQYTFDLKSMQIKN